MTARRRFTNVNKGPESAVAQDLRGIARADLREHGPHEPTS